MKQLKTLFYDTETNLLKALLFRPGKQVVRSQQLMPHNQFTTFITIQYCWKHKKKGSVILVDPTNPLPALEEFEKILQEADIVIGKNNATFDNRHINTNRLMARLPGVSQWVRHKSDDLERQIRKHFNLPSYSLDYVSDLIGLGGKIKMDFSDWKHIFMLNELKKIEKAEQRKVKSDTCVVLYGLTRPEIVQKGNKALKKMSKYGAKDAEDTKEIWMYCEAHIEPKHNYSTFNKEFCCSRCGSKNLRKNGEYTTVAGVTYTQYFCKDHNGYAGKLHKNNTLRN